MATHTKQTRHIDDEYADMFINVERFYSNKVKKEREDRTTSYIPSPDLIIDIMNFFNSLEVKVQLKTKINVTRLLAVILSTDIDLNKTAGTHILAKSYIEQIANTMNSFSEYKGIKLKHTRITLHYVMQYLKQFLVTEHNWLEHKCSEYKLPRYEARFGSQKKLVKFLKKIFKSKDSNNLESAMKSFTGFYFSCRKHLKSKDAINLDTNPKLNSKGKSKNSKNFKNTFINKTYKYQFDTKQGQFLEEVINLYKYLLKESEPGSELGYKFGRARKTFLSVINYTENTILRNNKHFYTDPYLNITNSVSLNNGREFNALVSLPKNIRKILFRNWISIDISNAAPNFILNLVFNQTDLTKGDIPTFYRYAKFRDAFFKDMFPKKVQKLMSLDTFKSYLKRIYLPVMFGANLNYDKFLIEYSDNEYGNVLKKVFKEMEEEIGKKGVKTFITEVIFIQFDVFTEIEKDLKIIAKHLKTTRKGLSNLFMKEETKIINHIIYNILRETKTKDKIRIHDEVILKSISFKKLFEIKDFLEENDLKCKIEFLGTKKYGYELKANFNELSEFENILINGFDFVLLESISERIPKSNSDSNSKTNFKNNSESISKAIQRIKWLSRTTNGLSKEADPFTVMVLKDYLSIINNKPTFHQRYLNRLEKEKEVKTIKTVDEEIEEIADRIFGTEPIDYFKLEEEFELKDIFKSENSTDFDLENINSNVNLKVNSNSISKTEDLILEETKSSKENDLEILNEISSNILDNISKDTLKVFLKNLKKK